MIKSVRAKSKLFIEDNSYELCVGFVSVNERTGKEVTKVVVRSVRQKKNGFARFSLFGDKYDIDISATKSAWGIYYVV